MGAGDSVRKRAGTSGDAADIETVAYRALLTEKARYAASEADRYADQGDYEQALDWLEVARTLSGELSLADRAKRRGWRVALLEESTSRRA